MAIQYSTSVSLRNKLRMKASGLLRSNGAMLLRGFLVSALFSPVSSRYNFHHVVSVTDVSNLVSSSYPTASPSVLETTISPESIVPSPPPSETPSFSSLVEPSHNFPSIPPSKYELIVPSSAPSNMQHSTTPPSISGSHAPSLAMSSSFGLPSSSPSGIPSEGPTVIKSGRPSGATSTSTGSEDLTLTSGEILTTIPSETPETTPFGGDSLTTTSSDNLTTLSSENPETTPFGVNEVISTSGEHLTTLPSENPETTPFGGDNFSSTSGEYPTTAPSSSPTTNPSMNPTSAPSKNPTSTPSENPTPSPSENPTDVPSSRPSLQPSATPTREHQSMFPSSQAPSVSIPKGRTSDSFSVDIPPFIMSLTLDESNEQHDSTALLDVTSWTLSEALRSASVSGSSFQVLVLSMSVKSGKGRRRTLVRRVLQDKSTLVASFEGTAYYEEGSTVPKVDELMNIISSSVAQGSFLTYLRASDDDALQSTTHVSLAFDQSEEPEVASQKDLEPAKGSDADEDGFFISMTVVLGLAIAGFVIVVLIVGFAFYSSRSKLKAPVDTTADGVASHSSEKEHQRTFDAASSSSSSSSSCPPSKSRISDLTDHELMSEARRQASVGIDFDPDQLDGSTSTVSASSYNFSFSGFENGTPSSSLLE